MRHFIVTLGLMGLAAFTVPFLPPTTNPVATGGQSVLSTCVPVAPAHGHRNHPPKHPRLVCSALPPAPRA